jgi:hypothetical protein
VRVCVCVCVCTSFRASLEGMRMGVFLMVGRGESARPQVPVSSVCAHLSATASALDSSISSAWTMRARINGASREAAPVPRMKSWSRRDVLHTGIACALEPAASCTGYQLRAWVSHAAFHACMRAWGGR